jgi:AcrR family transcriptional regulator
VSVTDPVRHRTRLAREERREQILDAAVEVFSGRDPAEVTFEEIADAAGVSRALVYNYFGDRHGLLDAVYQRNVDELREQVDEALLGKTTVRAALEAAVRVHVHAAAHDTSGYRYATGRLAFSNLPERREERVAEVAARIGTGPEAEVVAVGLLSAIEAMVVRWLELGDSNHEHAVQLITTFLASGLESLDLGPASLQRSPRSGPR